MNQAHVSKETIERHVGKWNTDIALGWETGINGKQRINGRLIDRSAPEHFYETQNHCRLADWTDGYKAALLYKKHMLCKIVKWSAQNDAGDVTGSRNNWGIKRSDIVTRLEKQRCYGDVIFYYFDGDELVRTVKCGI